MACENCGRTFLPDSLAIHKRSCKGNAAINNEMMRLEAIGNKGGFKGGGGRGNIGGRNNIGGGGGGFGGGGGGSPGGDILSRPLKGGRRGSSLNASMNGGGG